MKYKQLRFSLLCMLVMLCGGVSLAEEVSIDFTSTTEIAAMGFTAPETGKKLPINESFTYKGVTITPYAGSEPLSFYNSSGSITLRYYKESGGNKGGLGLAVENALITKVVITGNSQLANTTADGGTIEMSNKNSTLTWTASAESGVKSVTFLNGGTKTTNVQTITVTYTVGVETPPVETEALENIAALTAQTAADTYNVTLTDAVVTYTNGNYAYIQDESGAVVMYKKDHGLTAGQTLNGQAEVTYQVRNGNPQITGLSGATATEGTAPEPTEVAADDWNTPIATVLSQYFKVAGCTITQDGNKFYVQLGDENVQLYGQADGYPINVDDFEATYTIVGFPTMFNTTPELQIFVQPEKEETVAPIPENAIWTSDEPTDIVWDQPNITIPAEKFADAKVGDIIHVALQAVPTDATNQWDAQVDLRAQNWKSLDAAQNVAGTSTSAAITDAQFVITGDILAILQEQGAQFNGNNCKTALITLEEGSYTGSENSIWIGSLADNVTINKAHFANFNNFEGVKVGDKIRVTFNQAGWIGMNYNNTSWNWSDFPTGSFAETNDYTNPVVEFEILTDEAVKILTTQNEGIFINQGGDSKVISQVELIAGEAPVEETHLYIIDGSWDRTAMTELTFDEEKGGYVYTVEPTDDYYFAFADKQMTEEEASGDADWTLFNSEYRYAIGDGNQTPTMGEEVQLVNNTNNGTIKLAAGSYTIFVTKDLKMTITGEETPVEPEDTYVVAGSPDAIFGTSWNATDENNKMEKQEDGTYSITYKNVAPTDDVQLKVVKNGSEWIGDATGNNVTFSVTSECDVTVTYNPETNEVTVTGDGVKFATDFEYETVYVVGNGDGAWLNGTSWDPAKEDNKMAEVADDVWEITFAGVPAGTDYQVKFAIDGNWTHNFGGAFSAFGEETDAVYNGDNITFTASDETQDITIRLDLTGFDFTSKTGAKFTITTSGNTEQPEVEYYVVGPESGLGLEWSAADANKMEKQEDGTYKKTYEGVSFAAGDVISFKFLSSQDAWYPDGMGNEMTYTVEEEGTYDVTFTFNPEESNSENVVYTIDVTKQEEPEPEPTEESDMLKWTEDELAAAGATEAEYSSEQLTLSLVDVKGKMAVDANNCYFGDEETQIKFTHRLKTGATSSDNNYLTLTCASAGTLKIYARSANGSATDRNLVLTQNGETLYDNVVKDEDAIAVKGLSSSDPEKETKVYPIITIENVEAGEIEITYPNGSLNFYAFEFIPAEEVTDAIGTLKVNSGFDEKLPAYSLSGQRVDKNYRGVVIQNGRKFINK